MRNKFARLERNTGVLHLHTDFLPQVSERLARRDANPQGARFPVAEKPASSQSQLKLHRGNPFHGRCDFIEVVPIDLADKLQRYVKIFRRPPAGADKAELQLRERVSCNLRQR